MKDNGTTHRGHLGVLHTTLKCWEHLEFSILQEFQKIPALETRWNEGRLKKKKKRVSVLLLQSYVLHPSNSLGL